MGEKWMVVEEVVTVSRIYFVDADNKDEAKRMIKDMAPHREKDVGAAKVVSIRVATGDELLAIENIMIPPVNRGR